MLGRLCKLRITALLLLCATAWACSAQKPAPASAPVPTAAAPLEQPLSGALSRWNYYRENAGVPPVTADPVLGQAARSHSKYLVNNHIQGGDVFIDGGQIRELVPNPSMRGESPGNAWYTEAGEKAAASALVIRTTAMAPDGAAIVDAILSRGFNMLAMLDPQLTAIGYGQYCEDRDCVVTVASKWGLSRDKFLALYDDSRFGWNPSLGDMPFTRARLRRPIFFPSPGVPAMSSIDGATWPDPETSCGYKQKSGAPIVLELGAPASGSDDVLLSIHSVTDGGIEVESCAFDASSYKNPDAYQQRQGRWLLHQYGAVMVLAREPLKPGHSYTVSITADGTPYTWKFTVAPDAK